MKMKAIFVLSVIDLVFGLQPSKPCRLESADHGYVCTCDNSYCDSLDVPMPVFGGNYIIVTSSEAGDRFAYKKGIFSRGKCSESVDSSQMYVKIDRRKTFQKMCGFGGAFTGAVSHVINKLSPNLRNCIYKSYYNKRFGLGYNLMRIPIAGSDYDFVPWAYNECPENDASLSNFTELDPRDKRRNQQLHDLIAVSGNKNIKIYSAAWSPPLWMKTRYNWTGVNSFIKKKYYQTWADYHFRYCQLMKRDGIDIYSVSSGNEAAWANQNDLIAGLGWDPVEQGKWLVQYLWPTLKREECSNVQIHIYDDTRLNLTQWLDGMLIGDSRAMNVATQIGLHPYFDSFVSADVLDDTHVRFPHKQMLITEMTFCENDFAKGVALGSWERAERLMGIFVDNFEHHVCGFIDWNLLLNATRGPRYYSGATCDSYVVANDDFTKIYKQPMFYAMAHFSKFIPTGSRRIETSTFGKRNEAVQTIAFLRPDKMVTVILHNTSANETITVNAVDESKGMIQLRLKPKSINTLVYSIRRYKGECRRSRREAKFS